VRTTQALACFRSLPGAWVRALASHGVTTPRGVAFAPGALAGGAAFGQFNSAAASGIGRLDTRSGRLTRIWTYGPSVSGMSEIQADPPWLVWEQLDSQTNLADWSVHAWNLRTGAGSVLATSQLGNGRYVRGQQPLPVTRNGVAAWAQPVPSPAPYAQARIRVVDLASGRQRTLDTGRVSSPVYAGQYLIWGKIDDNGRFLFRAVDARSLKPAALPGPLQHPRSIGYLAGSPGYLAWSNQSLTTVTIWPARSARTRVFTASGPSHRFQFLQLAGHFLLWYNGAASSVLDLRTGAGFDVQGAITGSADAIAIAEPVTAATAKGAFAASRVSTVELGVAPEIASCS